jgi:hypothetical protein
MSEPGEIVAAQPLPPGEAGKRLLAFLGRYLGQGEVPMGSNSGPLVRTIQSHTWLSGTGWPWCSATDKWSWEVVFGIDHPYPTAAVEGDESWARKNGLNIPVSAAKAGDTACLGNGRHITRILSINRQAGTFVGRGGNQADMIKDSVYSIRDISTVISADREARFLGITADDERNEPPKPRAKPPVREIVRGDGEHARVVYSSRNLDKVMGRLERLLRAGARTVTVRVKPPPPLEDDGKVT